MKEYYRPDDARRRALEQRIEEMRAQHRPIDENFRIIRETAPEELARVVRTWMLKRR
ncbi:hypothetical protein HS125_18625 [bacterium]|nr:hypothetical protein [bacterium]